MMKNMSLAEKTVKIFNEKYNGEPIVVRSPGRVNFIGEHTDYNNGFVLPAAIDKALYFAAAPSGSDNCSLFSIDMNDTFEFFVNDIKQSGKHWPDYLLGITEQLIKTGYEIRGFNCVFGGDIPIGAGLSSSAAIEAGLGFALINLFNIQIENQLLAKLAQKAENEFVRVKCGIMDQFINLHGKKDFVLRLDCRSLEYEYFPFTFDNISIVLFNSGVSHSLASSEYNKRREECNQGVEILKAQYPEIESLRDADINMLNADKEKTESIVYKRCKYVIEENDRLLKACQSLIQNDIENFGKLMYQTHEGLSSEYEVSCPELDTLVNLTIAEKYVYGSRMMGGGFGGCTINLIETEKTEEVSEKIINEYKAIYGFEPKVYITNIAAGTEIIKI